MFLFVFFYFIAFVAGILFALVCVFIPKTRNWSEYITSGTLGTSAGRVLAHLIVILILWAAALSRPIHLYPAGTVFGALGPSGTDWPNLFISMVGILGGAAAAIAMLKRSKRKKQRTAT